MAGEGTTGRGVPALDGEQRLAWLRLIRTPSIGPRSFRTALNHFGGAEAAIAGLPGLAASKGRPIRITSRADALREMEALDRLGGRFIALGEADYPAALRSIESAPPLLAVLGDAGVALRPCVSVVGSRNASAAGLALARRFASGLGQGAFTVVSGLARGIDAAAHEAALPTGTVAVLAGGLDRPYPPENARLLDAIAAGGLVVSEMPLGWEPRGRDFPRRNRIVSGLSLGTVVVEAARQSGSLITARFALEQGREVFAVPGSPLDPRASGTNALIRDGATLVTEAEDVIAALRPLLARGPEQSDLFEGVEPVASEPLWDETDLFVAEAGVPVLTPPSRAGALDSADAPETGPAVDPQERVAGLIGPVAVAVDDVIRAAGLPAAEVRAVLVELEMAGRVERRGLDQVAAPSGAVAG